MMNLLLMVMVLLQELAGASGAKLVPVAPGWAGNSVNVVIFRRSSITSDAQAQYLAFYDNEGNVVLAKRKHGSAEWTIQKTQHKGNVRDAHNTISIALDGKGVLHMAWDHHGHPLRYAHGNTPGSLEMTDKLPMTGSRETNVTYPEFYKLADGDLLFLYRDGASGRGNLAMNRYDLQTGKWEQLHSNLIDGQGQRNAYWQAAVDEKGVIHVSWVWRESGDVATNHDVCYARSADGGKTWQKADGSAYALPINAANAEVAAQVPQKHELMNQTSMTTDSKGRAYIATYWREEGKDVPEYHIVYHDGSSWHTSALGGQTVAFRLGGGGTKRVPISRPQIFADSSGSRDKAYVLYRDEGRGNKVSVAICDDLAQGRWRIEDLTNGSVGQWEPSYDQALWQRSKVLNAFVQKAEQRDAEGVNAVPPEMVYVLEWKPQ